jgi:hypothetical protein
MRQFNSPSLLSADQGEGAPQCNACIPSSTNGGHIVRRALQLICVFLISQAFEVHAQNPKQIVQQAVQTELAASQNDHTHWMYYESEHEPKRTVEQWVAEAQSAGVQRVLKRNGQQLSESQQRTEMDSFINDTRTQAKQRKSSQHDDDQATEMLRLLPDAFLWTKSGEQGSATILHFKPDPQFHPPDLEARVFSAMEGDIAVDTAQHRIASLKGRLIHDVRFAGGLLGELKAGGSFDVERREIGDDKEWQITETHVHMQGHALLFKTISVNEDDQKSKFRQIPANTSLRDAESQLMQLGK